MANLKEDWIDFSKLQQELAQAVEKDARYWRENDAKLRAVGQRVETYEQFRDMVAAAHIKPLDKKDKIGQGKRNQPWNPFTSKATGPESSTSEDFSRKESGKLPKSSHAFIRDWKQCYKTTGEKYHFLKSIGGEHLCLIFRAEIGFGLLGEIVRVLNEHFQDGDLQCILDILSGLSGTNRFGLSLDFLDKGEKEQCGQLFQKLIKETDCLESQEDRSEVNDSESESKELNIVKDGVQDSGKETEQKQQSLAEEGIKDKLNVLREAYKL